MNTSLYDDPELYDARSRPEPFASFYKSIALEGGGPVLELGCGTGQVIVPIAEAGIACVGLDLSSIMLAAAEAYAARRRTGVRWVIGDMRGFSLEERFSTVFIARNTLLQLVELADLRACLASVRHHLLPAGRLVFDIFNPDVRILAALPNQRMFVRDFEHPRLGKVTLELTSEYDSATQVNRGTWYHSTADQPDFLVVPIHLRCIYPQELSLLLESVGFQLETRWGDFSRGAFTSDSRVQVCSARLL